MATQQVVPEDSFEAAVARARHAAAAAGELRPPALGRYVSPLGSGEREAVLRILRDGTYAAAAVAVGADDIDLADQ